MPTRTLSELYEGKYDEQRKRYEDACVEFIKIYKEKPTRFFSAPGRTEVSGNHTDHNHGRVIAAAVDLDIIACVCPIDEPVVYLKSEGFPEDKVDLRELSVIESEKNTSASLIRGVAKGLVDRGYKIGGFKAYTTSNVLKGSGLSSSAAFEVLIGTILNELYNAPHIANPIEIAQIAQYAENVYFGKPSGLMDQMASSWGGFITIDFAGTNEPEIDGLMFDLAKHNHSLCIVDTKGNHADLTPEYAAIPNEMKSVAHFFGKDYLREITKDDVLSNIVTLREKCGDRAILRALHFFEANERVAELCHFIDTDNFEWFLKYINASGNSSYKYLQNVFASSVPDEQGVSLALNVIERLLDGEGAHRVHGGGFAGTVQAFVPNKMLEKFKVGIEAVFGEGSCYVLNIRECGGTEVLFD